MIGIHDRLEIVRSVDPIMVERPVSNQAMENKIGIVDLKSNAKLKDFSFVPKLTFNLIYTYHLSKEFNCMITLCDTGLYLKDP